VEIDIVLKRNKMNKFDWMLSLKIGDQIEDCRGEIHTIKEIKNITIPTIFGKITFDRNITLDDDTSCLVMNCCDEVK
jgi:hypothetical protein